MDIALSRFNLYLLIALTGMAGSACQSSKSKKVETTLRIHTEARDEASFTRTVKVFKDETVTMIINEMPLLSDADVVDAQVVEALGGFAIQFKFNPMGRWQLDKHTGINIGRHYAIFVLFGEKPSVARWIAAPIISNRIANGVIIFTPDCTREEAELIVQGLPQEQKEEKPDGSEGREK